MIIARELERNFTLPPATNHDCGYGIATAAVPAPKYYYKIKQATNHLLITETVIMTTSIVELY